MLAGKWGFPMDAKETRKLVKAYLDSQGRSTRFVDNMPGVDWLECFLARPVLLSLILEVFIFGFLIAKYTVMFVF